MQKNTQTNMDNINWRFGNDVGETWTGEWDGSVSIYEGKDQVYYEFRLTKACNKEIFNADGISFGLKDNEVYLTTDKIDESSYYVLRSSPANTKNPNRKVITRKNLVQDLVKQIYGKLPDGKISINFLIKHCTENIWRITKTKII